MLKVKSPEGLIAYIKEDRLKEYQEQGYTKVTVRKKKDTDSDEKKKDE